MNTATARLSPEVLLHRIEARPPLNSHVRVSPEETEDPHEFPVDVFPGPIAQYIREGAESINVAADMIAMPMLGFAGGVIGNTCAVALKSKWIERAALWIALINDPGSGKSPAIGYARAPLDSLQTNAYLAYGERLKEWESKVASMKADKKNTEPLPEKPTLEHFFTTNSTTEALVRILSGSPGVVVVRDELVGWVNDFDSYRQGGDRQSWLESWASSPLKNDRVSSGTTYVPHPVVAIVGGIQPDLIPDLGKDANRRDGFSERFLMVSLTGKDQLWTDADPTSEALAEVNRVFAKLRLPLAPGEDGPVFVLTDEAKQIFADWYNDNGRIVKTSFGMAAGFYAKYPGQLARVALVLHCLHYPGERNRMVDAETVTNAIRVIEHLRHHLRKILPKFSAVGTVKTAGLAPRIMRILEKRPCEWFSREEIRKGLGNNAAGEDIWLTLSSLSDAGKVENRTVPTGARPREESRSLAREYMNIGNSIPESAPDSTYSYIHDDDEEEVRV